MTIFHSLSAIDENKIKLTLGPRIPKGPVDPCSPVGPLLPSSPEGPVGPWGPALPCTGSKQKKEVNKGVQLEHAL